MDPRPKPRPWYPLEAPKARVELPLPGEGAGYGDALVGGIKLSGFVLVCWALVALFWAR